VTLTLRQTSPDGPKVADVALTREEVPLKPKVRSFSCEKWEACICFRC
jgi:hypothetical protein